MKKLIPVLIIFIFCSCIRNKPLTPAELRKKDSINTVNQKRISDSITRRKELSKVAFGDAKFGMSLKEVMKKDGFRGGTSFKGRGFFQGKDYAWAPYEKLTIGDDFYIKIEAHFFNDSLSLVTIESYFQTANYIDNKLLDISKNLKDVIAAKYGTPNSIYTHLPRIYDFSPNETIWMYEWVIEEKIIRIGMREEGSGSKYQVYAEIFNKPMRERENKLETEKYNQQKKQQIKSDATKF